MEKEFVHYAEALALKELGFDEPCFGYYDGNHNFNYMINGIEDFSNRKFPLGHSVGWVSAPLKQQVFRWFRENYNIDSHIEYYPSSEDTVAYFFIADEDESINYGTYDEAEDKCIKFLIETVKNM